MKSNIITIMRKEFIRFFLDRRLVFATLILPGLIIFITYSFIGRSMMSDLVPNADGNYNFSIFAVNLPASVESAAINHNVHIGTTTDNPELIKQQILDKESDALVIFPADFDALVEQYDPRSGEKAPQIEIYYNSSSKTSAAAYQQVTNLLDVYKYDIANKFDINKGEGVWDLTKDKSGNPIISVLPMLLTMLMFSGCMAIVPESIAGEKERGTIATLLVTPIKKSELAAGKILSLGVMALLSGLSTFAGLLLGLSGMLSEAGVDITANSYRAVDFMALLIVVLSTVILNVTLISIISAFAKSVKESTTITTPLMLVNMLIGVSALSNAGAKTTFYHYLIPLYSSVQSMQAILASDYYLSNIALAVAGNMVYTCIGGLVLAKMFASEKIIFNK